MRFKGGNVTMNIFMALKIQSKEPRQNILINFIEIGLWMINTAIRLKVHNNTRHQKGAVSRPALIIGQRGVLRWHLSNNSPTFFHVSFLNFEFLCFMPHYGYLVETI